MVYLLLLAVWLVLVMSTGPTCCNSGAVGDEMHLVFECAALIPLRQQYASLFTGRTDTMPSEIIWTFSLRHYVKAEISCTTKPRNIKNNKHTIYAKHTRLQSM